MRDGSEPVPKPLACRRPKDNLAGRARHVDMRVLRIIKDEMEQRPVALTGVPDRPLIALNGFRENGLRGSPDDPGRRVQHDDAGFRRVYFQRRPGWPQARQASRPTVGPDPEHGLAREVLNLYG